MPSILSRLRSAKNPNNSASTPKPKPKPPSIPSQYKTLIQRRKKQVTKNLLDRTHLNGKSHKQRRLFLEKLRKKPLVSKKFERIQLYANSRNLIQSPSRDKAKEDEKFVKKFFKKNNSTKNLSKGQRTGDYGTHERYRLLHTMTNVYQAYRMLDIRKITLGDKFFSAKNYFAGGFSDEAKFLMKNFMEKDEDLKKRAAADHWYQSIYNQWTKYKNWCLKYHPNELPDPMAYALEKAETRT